MSGAAGRFSESAPAVVTAKALAVVFIAPMLDDVLALAEAARKNVNDHAISLAQQPKIYHYHFFCCHLSPSSSEVNFCDCTTTASYRQVCSSTTASRTTPTATTTTAPQPVNTHSLSGRLSRQTLRCLPVDTGTRSPEPNSAGRSPSGKVFGADNSPDAKFGRLSELSMLRLFSCCCLHGFQVFDLDAAVSNVLPRALFPSL